MNSTRKLIAYIGLAFLLLGSMAFLNNNTIVDTFHSLLYIVSGLFAVASAMRGEAESKRFAKVAGIIFALIFLGGVISPNGSILGIMRTTLWENIVNLIFAATLLYIAGAHNIARRFIKQQA